MYTIYMLNQMLFNIYIPFMLIFKNTISSINFETINNFRIESQMEN